MPFSEPLLGGSRLLAQLDVRPCPDTGDRSGTSAYGRLRPAGGGRDGREIEEFLRLLDDPAFAVNSYPLISSWGM